MHPRPSSYRPRRSENLRDLLVTLAVNLNHIADPQHGEQPLHIAIAQPDASVRRRVPNRPRHIRAMNPVALLAEPHPARSHGIVFAARDHCAGVVVSGIGNAVDDLKLPAGLGLSAAPTATANLAMTFPPSITASLRSARLTNTSATG